MKKYVLTTLTAAVLVTGCSTMSIAPDMKTGAIRGGAAGGIIGTVLGHNTAWFKTAEGVIGGTVGGAILGGLLGAANNQSQVSPASGEEN